MVLPEDPSDQCNKFNSGAAITFDELLNYNGYLNVHQSETNLGTLIAQGDIGQNELTGVNKVYTLNPVSDPLSAVLQPSRRVKAVSR